jgi:nucleotide-binding universal stress UspA family protein
MGIKTILVPIDGSKGSFSALGRAFVVAQRFGAHIEALHVMQRVSDAASYGFYNVPAKLRKTIESGAENAALEKAAELREQFEDFCSQYQVPLSEQPAEQGGPTAAWHQEFGHVAEVLVRHGRVSDLIAVPRPRVKTSTVRRSPVGEAIEAVLLETGRPVLIEPPKCKAKRCERVAIGWNESAEASRALAMTLPWLVDMSAVTVIVSKDRQPRVKAVVDYLAWHGVAANVQTLDDRGSSVGEAILNVCSDVGAEFVIIGGFSHARARELLFGGVTHYLLAESRIPTIMVH